MNIDNFRLEPNPDVPGDYLVFGEIYDSAGNLLGTYGPNGTSVFAWWVTQDAAFQTDYATQFAIVMANEIAQGTAE